MTSSAGLDKATGPDATIFIASINTASATELCIRSIGRYTRRDAYTLSVGDCGSTDGSLPRLMRLLNEHLVDDIALESHGRSHGEWLDHWTNTCATRFAAIVDSDIEILDAHWLDTLIATAEETGAAIVCAEFVDEIPHYVDHTGVARRLARRPSAWMMLLDVAKCRGHASWQFAMEDDPSIPELQWGLDTGALLMRELVAAGERVVAAPPGFEKTFRHFGGLSWVKMTRSKGWRYRASLLKVRVLNAYVVGRLLWLRATNARRESH